MKPICIMPGALNDVLRTAGLAAEHVLHLVKSRPAAAPARSALASFGCMNSTYLDSQCSLFRIHNLCIVQCCCPSAINSNSSSSSSQRTAAKSWGRHRRFRRRYGAKLRLPQPLPEPKSLCCFALPALLV